MITESALPRSSIFHERRACRRCLGKHLVDFADFCIDSSGNNNAIAAPERIVVPA